MEEDKSAAPKNYQEYLMVFSCFTVVPMFTCNRDICGLYIYMHSMLYIIRTVFHETAQLMNSRNIQSSK